MKRPLVVLCMVFCSGIWFSVFAAAVSFAVFFILSTAFAVLSLSAIKHRWEFTICLCLTVFFLGAATMRNVQEAAPNHIIKQLPFISGPIQLKGVIANEPRVNKGRTEFLFYCRQLIFPDGRSKKVCGRVLVKASGSYNFKYGQLLLLKGKLLRPFNFPLSIRLGYRDYLARKQIYCLMSVGKTGEVRDLKENCGNPLLGFSFRFKEKIETVINQNLSPIPASVLNAMILGERKSVPQFLNEAMVKTGTVHILVVSGFNVGIVAFIVLTLLKALRFAQRPRLWLTIFVLVFYCLLTGASTPVVRATIMGLVIIFGYIFRREPDIYNSLALSALIILIFNPLQIMEVGFQLSFISVLSIAWLYPKLKKHLLTRINANLTRLADGGEPRRTRISANDSTIDSRRFAFDASISLSIDPERSRRIDASISLSIDPERSRRIDLRPFALKVFNILGPLFCVSLSAWLGTAGLVAYYFGVVSLVTVLANILIVPLTSFITACGFALIISAKALPQASFLFAKSCETGVWLMWRINFILLRMTGAYFYIKAFPAAYLLGYYLLLVGFFAKLTNRGKCDTLRPI